MNNNIISTIGKRKTSVAKIFFEKDNTGIKINEKPFDSFFKGILDQSKTVRDLTDKLTNYKITIFVKGGGTISQVGAILLALSKFLSQISPILKIELKKKKLLTRDARIKERRKYGLKKARKASQYSKR
jgi:small subunit ribosomal protein S9